MVLLNLELCRPLFLAFSDAIFWAKIILELPVMLRPILGFRLGLGLCTVSCFYCSVTPTNKPWQPCCFPPEGRPGMSDVSPLSGISGLSFDSTFLSPLLFFCLVLLLFLSYLFFCLLVHSPELFPENSSNIFR